jgi:hypothetical protein
LGQIENFPLYGIIYESTLIKLGLPIAASSPNGKKGQGKGNELYRPGAFFAKNTLVINKIGAFIIKNSIIEGASGKNCEGEIKSESYNIDSDGSCGLKAVGDRSNIDPGLDSLRNNGGPSDTHALRQGSPTIDGGNPAGYTDHKGNALLTDQRGYIRPAWNRCDIGAFEASFQQ